jgi:hypothetical protein
MKQETWLFPCVKSITEPAPCMWPVTFANWMCWVWCEGNRRDRAALEVFEGRELRLLWNTGRPLKYSSKKGRACSVNLELPVSLSAMRGWDQIACLLESLSRMLQRLIDMEGHGKVTSRKSSIFAFRLAFPTAHHSCLIFYSRRYSSRDVKIIITE